MRKIIKIAGNELRALFFSPVAWFILVVFAFQGGESFVGLLHGYLRQQFMGSPMEGSITTGMLTGMFGMFTKIQQNLYFYIPLLTMGLMSREFGSGSIKLLYSSPVTATQIIGGKFLSMLAYGLVLIGVLFVFILFSVIFIPSFDFSLTLSGLLGLYLLVCAYSAIGLYMSCYTSYPVVAALGTLAVLIVLNFIGGVGQSLGFVREITYWLSIKGRATMFIDGLMCSEEFLYFVIVILFFLTLSVMKVESHRAKRKRVIVVGRYAIVVAVTVALGYLTSRPNLLLYYDMTANKTETLTKESQKVLKNMDGTLKITTYVNLLGAEYIYGLPEKVKSDQGLFRPYLRFKPDIKMEYVYYYHKALPWLDTRFPGLTDREMLLEYTDMLKQNPDRFKPLSAIEPKLDLESEGYQFVRSIELENGEKSVLRLYNDMMKHPTEAEVIAAFKRLIVKPPRVACLTGHGERDMNNVGDRDYYSFAKNPGFRYALVNQGFDVDTYSFTQEEEIPSDILVIADMKRPLEDWEMEELKRYIARGGNLLIAGEPGRQAVMNPVVEMLGVTFMPGTLVQPSKDFNADLVLGCITEGAVELMSGFECLYKKKQNITMPGAVGLSFSTDQGFNIRPLLVTRDSGSWNKLDPLGLVHEVVKINMEIGEKEESYPIALALSREVGNREQRILVLGDADCISNAELMMSRKNINASNFSLITEAFRWLSNGEFPVSTYRPEAKDTTINLELPAMKWVKIVLLWIYPLTLVGCGILIWRRRRRK